LGATLHIMGNTAEAPEADAPNAITDEGAPDGPAPRVRVRALRSRDGGRQGDRDDETSPDLADLAPPVRAIGEVARGRDPQA
jgi:hypothetical protein